MLVVVPLFDPEQVIAKLLEIARIVPQSVRTHIALVFEVLDELFERFVEHNYQ